MNKFYAIMVEGVGFKADTFGTLEECIEAAKIAAVSSGKRTFVAECLRGYEPVAQEIELTE